MSVRRVEGVRKEGAVGARRCERAGAPSAAAATENPPPLPPPLIFRARHPGAVLQSAHTKLRPGVSRNEKSALLSKTWSGRGVGTGPSTGRRGQGVAMRFPPRPGVLALALSSSPPPHARPRRHPPSSLHPFGRLMDGRPVRAGAGIRGRERGVVGESSQKEGHDPSLAPGDGGRWLALPPSFLLTWRAAAGRTAAQLVLAMVCGVTIVWGCAFEFAGYLRFVVSLAGTDYRGVVFVPWQQQPLSDPRKARNLSSHLLYLGAVDEPVRCERSTQKGEDSTARPRREGTHEGPPTRGRARLPCPGVHK